MSNITNLLENRFIDYLRGQAPAAITTLAWALIVATRGYSNSIRSQAVSLNDTVLPATPNGRIYRCTTAGTTGASEPSWPTTAGGTVADGTAVWTEQTDALDAGTFTEAANAGNYTRPSVAASLANMAGTQGAGTTVASTGTSGQTSNNTVLTFGSAAPSTNWGVVFGTYMLDSATYGSGTPLVWAPLATPKTVNSGDAQPTFPAGSFTFTLA
ncbi:phage tail fiber protein [Roseateles sp.]|jgi:hypothetical protein|uniref:phage tail fiber protein n=1 Tax=Roseateles sp. TaxID=1971397 RepID=UPI003BA40E5F